MAIIKTKETWGNKALVKRISTLERIPSDWRLKDSDIERAARQRDLTSPFVEELLDPATAKITALDTADIVSSLQNRKLSALQVTTAFCQAAAVAHEINNCLHEIFFDQAIARAKELDSHFTKHGAPIGPLHGLPVSLKDQFHVKGVDTTMGYVGWIGGNLGVNEEHTHTVESELVKELLSLGAVLYCKTSLPQTLLLGETINNIIGQTMNPHNTHLSCGGSSGGEGALLALRGSSIGFGTDIAGSVRIPASFCGVFALKPTPERISYRDMANTNPGQNTYRSTVGAMSSSLGGVELAIRSLLSTKPWIRDPAVVPIPWRQDVLDTIRARVGSDGKATGRPLRLGILWRDKSVEPHPPIRRGLQMVADAVRKAGHIVVDWLPPKHITGSLVHGSFLDADGAHDVQSHLGLSGEPLIPELQERFRLRDPMPLLEYQDFTLQGLKYETQYNDYWNSTADAEGDVVDAFIMPVAPHAAVIPGKYYYTGYTQTINLLNYSSVAIPVTKADKELDIIDAAYAPLDDYDRLNWDAYDPNIYHGGPVGVQIVARKFEEEKVIAIAEVVLSSLAAVDVPTAQTQDGASCLLQ